MHSSIIIVDDFLDNVDALRAAALSADYPEQDGNFAGRNSLQRIPVEGLDQQVERITGDRLVAMGAPQSHAKARLTMAGDAGRGGVHIDQSLWSGILYLSRPEDCRGGTRFFRHRATGSDRAPWNQAELEAQGLSSFEDLHRKLVAPDSNDPAKWDCIMEVPMRYNRLLLLRPWLWHTAGPGFGERPENARLVYLLFYAAAR